MLGMELLLAQELRGCACVCVRSIHRSAIKPLGDCNLALVKAHAHMVVKANAAPAYKIFQGEAKTLVDSLQAFLVRANTLCAEADTMTDMCDDKNMEALAETIAKQTTCADSHKIGATKAVARFSAMCDV